MPRTLTSEEYADKRGCLCPFCHSIGNIEGGPVEIEAGGAWQDVSCLDCESVWRDFYTLTGYGPQEG